MLIEVNSDGKSHTSEQLAWNVIMKAPSGWKGM